jgi:hypothetical protein
VLFAGACVLLILATQAGQFYWVPLMFAAGPLLGALAALAQARWGGWR